MLYEVITLKISLLNTKKYKKMGKPTGFLEYKREMPAYKPVAERIKDYKEFYRPFSKINVEKQAARCMDCGIPFCHNGCPLGNNIPDFNDQVYKEA